MQGFEAEFNENTKRIDLEREGSKGAPLLPAHYSRYDAAAPSKSHFFLELMGKKQ